MSEKQEQAQSEKQDQTQTTAQPAPPHKNTPNQPHNKQDKNDAAYQHPARAKQPQAAYACGCSSMVERKPSKLKTRVRFPSPAPHSLNPPAPAAPTARVAQWQSVPLVRERSPVQSWPWAPVPPISKIPSIQPPPDFQNSQPTHIPTHIPPVFQSNHRQTNKEKQPNGQGKI